MRREEAGGMRWAGGRRCEEGGGRTNEVDRREGGVVVSPLRSGEREGSIKLLKCQD